jgi:tetratricopeptide (TPR) repeat protein
MASDKWFRNVTWSDTVAQTFEAKLRRARRKEHYLRIQASMLRESHPEVAHALLDRYFALPDQFDAAQAHVDRAHAYLAQQKLEEAILAFERALSREDEFPDLKTDAYIDLPFEIATRRLLPYYDRALDLLKRHQSRRTFPVDFFKWNAAQALIAASTGRTEACHSFARAALDASERRGSGFSYRPDAGLVSHSLSAIVAEMKKLSAV